MTPTRMLPAVLGTVSLLASTLSSRAECQAPIPDGPPLPETITLAWAVDAALLTYPAVGAARARLEGARAEGSVARSAWWPQLSFNGNATRFQLPMLVRPLHELDPGQIEFNDTPVQGNLSLDFPILNGERGPRIREADATAEGASATLVTTRMTVIQTTAEAYLNVLTLRDVLAAERTELQALGEERARAQQLLDAGRAPRVELLRAEAALSQANADVAATSARLRAAEDRLGRLVGVDGSAITESGVSPVESVVSLEADRPSAVDSLHPVLLEAWSRIARADAARDRASGNWIPDLGVSAGMRQFGTVEGDFTNEWQIGLVLSYPLFTGFRRTREIEVAEARVSIAREEARLRRLEVDQQLDDARAALAESQARVDALEQAVQQFAEVARIEALALETGVGVQQDYLDAVAALRGAQASLAQARNVRVLATIREASALGILDRDWIVTTLESVQ